MKQTIEMLKKSIKYQDDEIAKYRAVLQDNENAIIAVTERLREQQALREDIAAAIAVLEAV